MEMKQYLLDTWAFNDRANKQVLASIREMPDKEQSIRFFSHLINSQNKWLARINQFPKDPGLDWWEPAYPLQDLEREWDASLAAWRAFLGNKSEDELFSPVRWVGFDGKRWTAPLKDIVLQLNYHSIHHRAQIQALIRAQGLAPDFVDYIGTVYRRVDD
jgi:uncharacterized damage-inducible protein DinB